MPDIFTPVDSDQNETEKLDALAQKFGVQRTPETEKILKAKLESDNFILQQQAEAEELRKEVSSKATIDEIMTQIRSLNTRPQEPQPNQPPVTPSVDNDDDLEAKVLALLEKRKAKDRIEQNRSTVEAKIAEKWGADAQININKKAKELGTTVERLRQIAVEEPSLFFAMTGLDKTAAQAQPVVAPRTSVNPNLDNQESYDERYWARMKSEDPTKYFSVAETHKRHKQMMTKARAEFA